MGYTMHTATVGVKMLASWWNELVGAINGCDGRILTLEALTVVENASVTSGTVTNTSYAASSSGALTASCPAPQSGKVRVTIQAEQWGTSAIWVRTSAAVSVSAGSGAAAASDDKSIRTLGIASGSAANNGQTGYRSWLVTGLTPGATVTATMQHKAETTGTIGIQNRRISVEPITGW